MTPRVTVSTIVGKLRQESRESHRQLGLCASGPPSSELAHRRCYLSIEGCDAANSERRGSEDDDRGRLCLLATRLVEALNSSVARVD